MCQYTPDNKRTKNTNQTKMCAIMVFYVYFVLYIELLFGNVDLNGSLMNNLFYGQQVSSIKDVDSVGLYYITNASEMPTGDPFIVYSLGIVGRSWNYPIFAFNAYSNYMLYIGRNSTNDGVSYAFSGWTQIQINKS